MDFHLWIHPLLNYYQLLETKSGPAIRDEIYYFNDKGDREVALRFDFTMGLTRYASFSKINETASQTI